MRYETIIGLEIHVQLKTKSKMFCRCDNTGEYKPPNSTICPVCSGQPGALPVVNQQAIDWAIWAALALGCKINPHSKFDRKSYFYPDLPKGYQISQYDLPIAEKGFLEIEVDGKLKKIRLTRLHLEEDSAKLIHQKGGSTLVDFNRAGTPLLEIVTEPDVRSPEEAHVFMQELRLIMRYLGISDADMERGQLRCDANISLRFKGDKKLYPKTEIKNLNSFKAVEAALAYEAQRQSELWDQKKAPKEQSTRGWDENKGVTVEQRTKEEEKDYRYFPEPDLPPLNFSKEYIAKLKSEIPELPYQRRKRFQEVFGFSQKDADVLVRNKNLANYAEQVISELKEWLEAEEQEKRGAITWKTHQAEFIKLIANWLIHRLMKHLKLAKQDISKIKITPENFAELITLIYQKRISNLTAQQVLEEMFNTGGDPSNIIEERGLGLIADERELGKIIDEVLQANPRIVEEYQGGKTQTLQFFIGQVMRRTKGQADPKILRNLLIHKLR